MKETVASIVDQLSSVLDERDRLYPVRNDDNTTLMHELMDQLVVRLDSVSDSQWTPGMDLVSSAEKIQDKAVFLCGYMKSGTTLLLGLLDGHPELNVMPGDSYLINKFSHNPPKKKYSWGEWRKNWLKRMINATGQKPFWTFGQELSCYADFLQYMDYWVAKLPEEKRRPILTAVLSYFCANPDRPQKPQWWVEKTPGNEFKTKDILNHFPRARMIHIVRDPRDNFASLKRLYASRGWTWDYIGMVRMFARSFKIACRNQRQLGKSQYLVISYEDLTANTKVVMTQVAEFLDIAWDDSLLVPTLNAQPAQANTMYKERQITGKVRRSAKAKWRDELDASERRAVGAILPEAKAVGYEWEVKWHQYLTMLMYRLRIRV